MRAAILAVAFASLCLAQMDDNTVTITATRSITLQPDQAVVGVNVTAPATAGLDEILAALQGTGIDAGDLVYTATNAGLNLSPVMNWQFSKTVPFSGLKDTLAALLAAQQKLEKQIGGFDLSYYVNSQPSQAAQQAPALCPIPTLFSEAQAQAQRVADAVGARADGVVSMSQRGLQPSVLQVPTFVSRTGDFSAIYDPLTGSGLIPVSRIVGVLSPAPLPLGSTCSLTVQFKLLR